MKNIIILLILLISPPYSFAEEATVSVNLEEGISLGFFKFSDFKWQCGCWYHYPFEKGTNGKLLINFEYGTDSAHIIINGKKRKLGNWKSKKESGKNIYQFNDGEYELSVISTEIKSGKYASDHESIIKLKTKEKTVKLKTYGSCGC